MNYLLISSISLTTLSLLFTVIARFTAKSNDTPNPSTTLLTLSIVMQLFVYLFILAIYFLPFEIPYYFIANLIIHVVVLLFLIISYFIDRSKISKTSAIMLILSIILFIFSIPFTVLSMRRRKFTTTNIKKEIDNEVEQSKQSMTDDNKQSMTDDNKQSMTDDNKQSMTDDKVLQMTDDRVLPKEVKIVQETQQPIIQQVPPCGFNAQELLRQFQKKMEPSKIDNKLFNENINELDIYF